jgi:hypothetical protein
MQLTITEQVAVAAVQERQVLVDQQVHKVMAE